MTTSLNVPVYDPHGKKQEPWTVDLALLGVARPALLAQALRVYSSNRHQKTSQVKTRGEVVGSTRKIYRQKGTGNARHGAKYAPIFVGGGIAHGPTGVRPHNLVLPKSMRRRALAAALHAKLTNDAVAGLSAVTKVSGKTAHVAALLHTIASHPEHSVLILTKDRAPSLYLSVQNLQGVVVKRADLINAFDLISADHLILTKPALDLILSRIAL